MICSERLSRATSTLFRATAPPIGWWVRLATRVRSGLARRPRGPPCRHHDADGRVGLPVVAGDNASGPDLAQDRRTTRIAEGNGPHVAAWRCGRLVCSGHGVATHIMLLASKAKTGRGPAVIVELHDETDFTMRSVATTVGAIGSGAPFPPERGARLQITHVIRSGSIISCVGEYQSPRCWVLRRVPRADPEPFVSQSWLAPLIVLSVWSAFPRV